MMQDQIQNKYPVEFEHCTNFTISEHWLPIVEKLLNVIIMRRRRLHQEPLRILQIKSKFGGLRFNCIATFEIEEKYINAAEKQCKQICEVCGSKYGVKQEQIRTWVWTICPTCANKKRLEIKHEI